MLEAQLAARKQTVAAMAISLGASERTVKYWLTGETAPRLRFHAALRSYLKLSPSKMASLLTDNERYRLQSKMRSLPP